MGKKKEGGAEKKQWVKMRWEKITPHFLWEFLALFSFEGQHSVFMHMSFVLHVKEFANIALF